MYQSSFIIILITVYVTMVHSACTPPVKYYLDCASNQTLAYATQRCLRFGMVLLNISNSSNLIADINLLNETLRLTNCTSNFWFSSGNQTGIVANVNSLGNVLAAVLGGLIGGLLGTVGAVIDILICLLGGCLGTTTPPPITYAVVICMRPMQQRVIQKCQMQSVKTDMKVFQFREQPAYGGVLDSFASRSRTICSGLCSSDPQCTGISYINGICTLYI